MFVRLLQSVLVGLGASVLAVPLFLTGLNIYIHLLVTRQPGLGAVAGGLAPSSAILIIMFIAGFLWNWHITRNR
jgi:hypothetical protein